MTGKLLILRLIHLVVRSTIRYRLKKKQTYPIFSLNKRKLLFDSEPRQWRPHAANTTEQEGQVRTSSSFAKVPGR